MQSASTSPLPQRTRVYQSHHFDSTRWDYFEPRDDDIIIATSYKAGTTWTQAIVAHLLFPDGNFPQLSAGIHAKLFTLPDETRLLSGHGEPTTVGEEKRHNPFVGLQQGGDW